MSMLDCNERILILKKTVNEKNLYKFPQTLSYSTIYSTEYIFDLACPSENMDNIFTTFYDKITA